jgi:hypothetical protein
MKVDNPTINVVFLGIKEDNSGSKVVFLGIKVDNFTIKVVNPAGKEDKSIKPF